MYLAYLFIIDRLVMGTLRSSKEGGICQVQDCTVTSSHLQLYLPDKRIGERSSVPNRIMSETKRPAKLSLVVKQKTRAKDLPTVLGNTMGPSRGGAWKLLKATKLWNN